MGRNRRNHSQRYAEIAGGRVKGSWTGTDEHSPNCRVCPPVVDYRIAIPHDDADAVDSFLAGLTHDAPSSFPPLQRLRGAVDLYFEGMMVRIRSRGMRDKRRRHSFTVRTPVREMAARIPTIVLLEELAARAELPSTALLLDALQTHGHELGEPLAELLQRFTEKVAMLRRANAVEGKDGDNS